jgi:acid phosphatase
MVRFRSTYLRAIAKRLRKQLAVDKHFKLDFTDDEIYAMQEMCGFETIARGKSPWCDVFTRDEWEQFEYARDLMHYYRTGPGNTYSAAIGSLWLNATGKLLAASGTDTTPVSDPFYFSFTHDSDVVSILSTLGLFLDGPNRKLPATRFEPERSWRMSQVVPMGGRIVFERLVCIPDDAQPESKGIFIRLNVNDGIVAVPGCARGPGLTCPLKDFLGMLDEKLDEAGSFVKACGLPEGSPAHIEFLHQ